MAPCIKVFITLCYNSLFTHQSQTMSSERAKATFISVVYGLLAPEIMEVLEASPSKPSSSSPLRMLPPDPGRLARLASGARS